MSLRRSGIELARPRDDDEPQRKAGSSLPKQVAFAPLPSNSTLAPPPPEAMSALAGSPYADKLVSGERVSPRKRKARFVRRMAFVALVLAFAAGFVTAFVHRLSTGC